MDKLKFTTSRITTPTRPQHGIERRRRRTSANPTRHEEVVASSSPSELSPSVSRQESPLFEPADECPQEAIAESPSHRAPFTSTADIRMENGERAYYRDAKQVKREVWQPGDGDGDFSSEYFGSPVKIRYRFFQSHMGPIVKTHNEPPHYVLLDDQAAYDVLKANTYTKSSLARYWSHDFTVTHGTIRAGRPNRGRPATVSVGEGEKINRGDSAGEQVVAWAYVGDPRKKVKYYFTGERNGYTAVEFAGQSIATKAGVPGASLQDGVGLEAHSLLSNSFRAVIDIVEMNDDATASSMDTYPAEPVPKRRRGGDKLNTFLHRTPSPKWPMAAGRLSDKTDGKRKATDALAQRLSDSSDADDASSNGRNAERARRGRDLPVGRASSHDKGGRCTSADSFIETARQARRMKERSASMDTITRGLWDRVRSLEQDLSEAQDSLWAKDQEIGHLKRHLREVNRRMTMLQHGTEQQDSEQIFKNA